MVHFCCIKNCSNRSKKSTGTTFHRFPTKNEVLLKKWLERCVMPLPGRLNLLDSRRICSSHFRAQDYVAHSSKTLVPNAIPSLNLPSNIAIKTKFLINHFKYVNEFDTSRKSSDNDNYS